MDWECSFENEWYKIHTYLHIYHEDRWSAPPQSWFLMCLQIVVMYLQMFISIRPWRVGKSLIPIFPGCCHIQASPRSITPCQNVPNECELLIIRYCAYGYWHILVPCQKLEKACPIRDNITMLLHMFLFWSYFVWIKFWATLQDWVMNWIHHQVI